MANDDRSKCLAYILLFALASSCLPTGAGLNLPRDEVDAELEESIRHTFVSYVSVVSYNELRNFPDITLCITVPMTVPQR
jgi:hypothetical protein